MSDGATRATAPIHSVVRRGGAVFAGLRRTYEPSLWRRELATQLRMLLTGHLAGRGAGRDHEGIAARRYSARSGDPAVWLRHGTGDAAVWGEVYVRGVYVAPWPVPAGLRVLDLGGHIGLFARWALDEWDARSVLSVEPDPGNAEVLRHNLGELDPGSWRLEIAAAACAEGTARFAGGRGAGSALGTSGEDTVRTIDAIPLLADCELAKVDIEGGEWALLEDPRFAAAAPQMIVVEHHPAASVDDPAARARDLLEAAGYDVVAGQAEEDVSGVGVLWGLRRPPLSDPEPDVLDSPEAGGRAIRGGALRTGSYVLTLLLGLISVPLMTRQLGVVEFGYYVTVLSIVFVVGTFSEAGLTNLGVREYSTRAADTRARYLQTLTGLRLLLTTAGMAGCVAFAWISGQPHDVILGTAIVGFSMFLGMVQQTYVIPLTSRLRFGWLSALDLLRQVVLVGVIAICAAAGSGLIPFFFANVAAYAVLLLATLVLVRSMGIPLLPVIDWAAWRAMARQVAPYALSAVAGVVYFRIAVILLAFVSDDREVGIYSTAFRVTEVVCAAPAVLVAAAFPILARAARDDDTRLRAAVQRLFNAALLLGGLAALGLVVGARFAIGVLAPIETFGDAVPVLRIQVLAVVFSFVVATFSFVLLSLERYRDLLWCNLAALTVAVVGTLGLGSAFDARGAAVATTAAEATLAVACMLALARRRPELVPRLTVVPKLLAGAGVGALFVLTGLPVVVQAAGACAAYVAVAWATGAIDEEIRSAVLRR